MIFLSSYTCILQLSLHYVSIAHIATDFHVSKRAISDLKQTATGIPDNTMPTRKAGTGTKKRTTDGTNAVRPGDVILNPSINHANLKRSNPSFYKAYPSGQFSTAPEGPESDIMLCS